MSNLLDEEKKSMHADEEKCLHKLIEEAKDALLKVEETNKDYEDLRMKHLKLAEERDLSEAAQQKVGGNVRHVGHT